MRRPPENTSVKLIAIADRLGFLACCGMAASFTTSRALFNLFCLLVVAFWILSGRILMIGQVLRQSPAALGCFLLFTWIAVGLAYTSAPIVKAESQVLSYAKLLLVPLLVSFLDRHERVKSFAIVTLIGLGLLLTAFIADIWIDIPFSRSITTNDIGVFNNYIVEGLSFGTLAVITLTIAIEALKAGRLYISISFACLGVLTLYVVFFLNPGRGAQVATIVGMMVVLTLATSGRWRWVVSVLALVGLLSIAAQSELSRERFNIALKQLQSSSESIDENTRQRLAAWNVAYDYWKQRPFVGHGPGTYRELIHADKSGRMLSCEYNPTCLQPHSQYILFLVEQGGVGLILFLTIIEILIRPVFFIRSSVTIMAAAFGALFAAHSIFDSGMRMGTQMFIFVVVGSGLAAALRIQKTGPIIEQTGLLPTAIR
jgi:O-antigen ligase